MLRREADNPGVVAATKIPRPMFFTPPLSLSGPEARMYHACYHSLFAAAEAELARVQALEADAERRLRGANAAEAARRAAAASAEKVAAVASATSNLAALRWHAGACCSFFRASSTRCTFVSRRVARPSRRVRGRRMRRLRVRAPPRLRL